MFFQSVPHLPKVAQRLLGSARPQHVKYSILFMGTDDVAVPTLERLVQYQ